MRLAMLYEQAGALGRADAMAEEVRSIKGLDEA
jgi:hypothetical protein